MEAINLWIRYLNFLGKHVQVLAKAIDLETDQFLDLCLKKAIAATQYHISEVI